MAGDRRRSGRACLGRGATGNRPAGTAAARSAAGGTAATATASRSAAPSAAVTGSARSSRTAAGSTARTAAGPTARPPTGTAATGWWPASGPAPAGRGQHQRQSAARAGHQLPRPLHHTGRRAGCRRRLQRRLVPGLVSGPAGLHHCVGAGPSSGAAATRLPASAAGLSGALPAAALRSLSRPLLAPSRLLLAPPLVVRDPEKVVFRLSEKIMRQ